MYIHHDPSKPDSTTQNIAQFGTSTRTNANALRDGVILGGGFPGFDLTTSGGTTDEPAFAFYTKGAEILRVAITWGTTGGADGNPVQLVYSYSANAGGLYEAMGTQTITYGADGNVVSSPWS
jgi:hypothetical protein